MLTRQRKAEILRRLGATGQIVAKELSRELGLSEDTIRRDLRELAADGLLQRVHGGALPVSPAMAGLAERRQVAPGGKAAVGRTAAAMIRPGQIVFLDGGTTATQLARHLPRDLQATIVTHSPTIAVELIDHERLTVELIGGRMFKHSMVAVGAIALEAIGRIRPDVFFMGVTGIHVEFGLTTGDSEEAAIKRAISRASAETVVLASSEKLGAVSPCLVASLDSVDAIISEVAPSDALRQQLEAAGVETIRAR